MIIRLSSKITALFLKELYPVIGPVKCAMAYMPIQSEVRTGRLMNTLTGYGVKICVPCVKGNNITPAVYSKSCKMVKGAFKIKEPAKITPVSSPKKIDLVIVPGIAFDDHGRRIGFGRGFYDRFLKRVPKQAVKVGIAFEKQILPSIPAEEHDVRMDFIVTEKRIIKTSGWSKQ